MEEREQLKEKDSISRFSRSGIFFFFIAFLLLAAQWGILFWKFPPQEGTVFLHYNIYFGIDATGEWNQLLWIPGAGAALFLFNSVVLLFFRPVHHFFPTFIAIMTACIEAMIFVALALILYINLS